jgi:hypothetical protein
MKYKLFIITAIMLGITNLIYSQTAFTWTTLPPMPEPVSNNAVTSAYSSDTLCIYSFSGIDTSKSPNGIHNKCFKYNTITQQWSQLPDLPQGLTRIAAGASTINNKIYIIGGYHVFENFNEESLNDVHVFDPETNTFLSDATPIPTPIDDHVQAVWRDSLIFVITGWSQNTNVANVQIFNPALNEWTAGTPVPNNNFYKAFGASGDFVGDTIYYNGGAVIGASFPGTAQLRKGIVNPDNPNEIEWSVEEENPGSKGYRMGSISLGNKVFWVGGGGQTYNFDGVAYNGSGIVEPLKRIMHYDPITFSWTISPNTPFSVMDMRGIAKVSESSFIICEGMTSEAEVSDAAYLIEVDFVTLGINELNETGLKLWPVPANEVLYIDGIKSQSNYDIMDSTGELVLSGKLNFGKNAIYISALIAGTYI